MLLCGEWDVFPILTCTWLRFVLRADHILTAFLQQTETLPLSPRPHPYLSNATPSSSTKASLSTRRVILNVQQSLPKRARGLFSSLLLLSRFSCVRPHRWQPTRGPRPWDSPGKNTGVGCHFLLQCMKVKSESEVAQSCPTLCDPTECSPPGSSVHGSFQARALEWVPLPWPHRVGEVCDKGLRASCLQCISLPPPHVCSEPILLGVH